MRKRMLSALGMVAIAAATGVHAEETKPVFEGNEAVWPDKKTGQRRVDYPPYLINNESDQYGKVSAPMPRWQGDLKQGFPAIWYMIEGPSSLLECGGLTINPNACRAPTLGVEKWKRVWVVKRAGKWVHCTGGKKPYRCADRSQIVTLATRPGDQPE